MIVLLKFYNLSRIRFKHWEWCHLIFLLWTCCYFYFRPCTKCLHHYEFILKLGYCPYFIPCFIGWSFDRMLWRYSRSRIFRIWIIASRWMKIFRGYKFNHIRYFGVWVILPVRSPPSKKVVAAAPGSSSLTRPTYFIFDTHFRQNLVFWYFG